MALSYPTDESRFTHYLHMVYQNYVVIDIETSIKNRGENAIGKTKASPHCPDNKIVYTGSRKCEDLQPLIYKDDVTYGSKFHEDLILVGQNIKFDLLYLLYRGWNQPDFIWDTMIVEYLLSGQQDKFASLDHLCRKYSLPTKPDKVKKYWENNVDTEDIPDDLMREYLTHDLKVTEVIFIKQRERAIREGKIPLIKAQMDALLATTEMEFNGMHFDIMLALEHAEKLQEKINKSKDIIVKAMANVGIKDPNPSSNVHLSLLFFGGKQERKESKEVYLQDGTVKTYKTGRRKGMPVTKLMAVVENINPEWTRFLSLQKLRTESKKDGVYVVSEMVLKELSKWDNKKYVELARETGVLAKHVLEYRKNTKDLSTYYVGLAKLVWPHSGMIHGNIHHCATNTGRLASSAPNMQNIAGDK